MARWQTKPSLRSVVEAVHDPKTDSYHTTDVKTGEYRLVKGAQHRSEYEEMKPRGPRGPRKKKDEPTEERDLPEPVLVETWS